MRLLGTRDLKRYRGWKGTPELIAKEHARNRATGEANGTWRYGVVDTTVPARPAPKPPTAPAAALSRPPGSSDSLDVRVCRSVGLCVSTRAFTWALVRLV
jgi:hypothetical protein